MSKVSRPSRSKNDRPNWTVVLSSHAPLELRVLLIIIEPRACQLAIIEPRFPELCPEKVRTRKIAVSEDRLAEIRVVEVHVGKIESDDILVGNIYLLAGTRFPHLIE